MDRQVPLNERLLWWWLLGAVPTAGEAPIPEHLLEEILHGNCVAFVGAGER